MKNSKVMKIAIIVLALVLVFAAVLAVQAITNKNKLKEVETAVPGTEDSKMNDAKNTEPSFQGDAYNFQLVDVEGNTHILEKYAGKKVYIKFWATWCPSCLDGLEELGELHELTKDRDDIVILTVVAPGYSGEKSKDKFIEWYKGQEMKFTVLLDIGGNTFFEYGIRAVPKSFFIDGRGNLAEERFGHVYNDDILKILDSL